MRIAVNTRLLLKGQLEGIGWYTHETLKRIVLDHPEHEFIFFFDRPYDSSFVFAPNVTPVVFGPPARHPLLYYIWYELRIPYMLRKYRADVFVSPDGITSLLTRVPTCIVIHDLAFVHYPRHLKPVIRHYLIKNTPLFAQKAKRIVTVSEYSKKDIASQYGIAEEKIAVSCNGAHSVFRPLSWEEKEAVKKEISDGCEYFLYVGALHPRKNITQLLAAFIRFKRRQKSNMKLVVVGRMAWKNKKLVHMKENMPYKEEVRWLGYKDTDALSQIVGAAYALTYVSLFEGFGIPILEAFQCRVPAIVSNTSSMPEVGGDAALLADPEDHEDIATQMERIYKDEGLRSKLIAATDRQVTKYTWEKAAAVLYENILLAAKS